MDNPSFTEHDVELCEEMLTELTYLALISHERLRKAWLALAEGVAMMVSPEALERSKEYALYRMQQRNK